MGLLRPPVEVEVDSAPPDNARVCAFAEWLLEVALIGPSPPPDATPEDFEAVSRVNVRLAEMADALRRSEPMKELGCG